VSYILINFNNYCNISRKSLNIACTRYEDYVIMVVQLMINYTASVILKAKPEEFHEGSIHKRT
jgi:hypothetical protein